MEVHTTEEVLQAKAHIWNHTFNFINSMSLKCAVELGMFDAIRAHGKPITVPDLAAAISVPSIRIPCLKRLLHLMVHSDFLAREAKPDGEEDVFTLTTVSSLLLIEERKCSLGPLVLLALDNVFLDPFLVTSEWFKRESPPTPFELAHGIDIWPAMGQWPKTNGVLNRGMASDTRVVIKIIIKECSDVLQGLTSLVDVGGGTGEMAHAIVEAFPQIKCTVLDLPHVAVLVEESEGVKSVSGDMLVHIPPADAVLLKWIMQDWDDEECVQILKRCKEAISGSSAGKVIIVDMVLNPDGLSHALVETQLLFDQLIMHHTTGKQRYEADWKKIITEAGFKDYKIIPSLGLRSIIEVFP